MDPEISGHHLTFKWSLEKDCLQVRDEKSFNGSALNFKIMTPMKFYDVKDGSVLKTGKSTFTIHIRDKEEETKTTSSMMFSLIIVRLLLPSMLQGYFTDDGNGPYSACKQLHSREEDSFKFGYGKSTVTMCFSIL